MAGLGSAFEQSAMRGGRGSAATPGMAGAGAAPVPQTPDLGGMEEASPEEQAVYNRFMAAYYNFVYDGKAMDKVLGMLGGGGEDPISALAVTAAMVVARVEDAAESSGEPVPGDIILHAGAEAFEDLAELATRAGIHDFTKDRDGFEAAWYRALDEYRVMRQSQGKLDQGVFQQDLAGLQQADQDGSLAATMRSLEDMGPADEAPASEPQEDEAEEAAMRGGLGAAARRKPQA